MNLKSNGLLSLGVMERNDVFDRVLLCLNDKGFKYICDAVKEISPYDTIWNSIDEEIQNNGWGTPPKSGGHYIKLTYDGKEFINEYGSYSSWYLKEVGKFAKEKIEETQMKRIELHRIEKELELADLNIKAHALNKKIAKRNRNHSLINFGFTLAAIVIAILSLLSKP